MRFGGVVCGERWLKCTRLICYRKIFDARATFRPYLYVGQIIPCQILERRESKLIVCIYCFPLKLLIWLCMYTHLISCSWQRHHYTHNFRVIILYIIYCIFVPFTITWLKWKMWKLDTISWKYYQLLLFIFLKFSSTYQNEVKITHSTQGIFIEYVSGNEKHQFNFSNFEKEPKEIRTWLIFLAICHLHQM